jgi:flavin reductase (DIM6/NTAB) family NADH-FMN oxidoreductase RutF
MFVKISPFDINENVFKLLDKDWMLVTAGKGEDFNLMTASWGHLGILWNLPVAICYIRPQRYTFDFANRYDDYTLSFFPEKYRKQLRFCGTKSGRDYDKVKETGFSVRETDAGNIFYEEAKLVLECNKIYQDDLKVENFIRPEIAMKNYPKNDFHRFYFGEITSVLIKDH